MSSILCSSQGVFLATAMAAGTVILLAFRLQKSPSSQFQVNSIPILRPCLSSGEKRGEKKKKRVRFAEDVVDPRRNNEEFRRQHSNNILKRINNNVENNININNTNNTNNQRLMPANRVALYKGIIRDRVIHRVTYSY